MGTVLEYKMYRYRTTLNRVPDPVPFQFMISADLIVMCLQYVPFSDKVLNSVNLVQNHHLLNIPDFSHDVRKAFWPVYN